MSSTHPIYYYAHGTLQGHCVSFALQTNAVHGDIVFSWLNNIHLVLGSIPVVGWLTVKNDLIIESPRKRESRGGGRDEGWASALSLCYCTWLDHSQHFNGKLLSCYSFFVCFFLLLHLFLLCNHRCLVKVNMRTIDTSSQRHYYLFVVVVVVVVLVIIIKHIITPRAHRCGVWTSPPPPSY